MKIAAAYIRVSTEDQVEYSPDSQLRAIQSYAEKNGYYIPEQYIFIDEGISGRSVSKREGFKNHNHPSNGWFAQGLKAQYYRPAAQAAGFRILKPIAFATFAALERAFVLLATLKRVFVFLHAQLVKRYVMFLLILDILPYGAFVKSYRRNVVPFCPKVSVPKFIF